MILVLAGTADGRELARLMQAEGYQVLVSTATDYGRSLAQATPVRSGVLDKEGFVQLIREQGIKLLVDASHPFAANVSHTAIAACRETGIPYLRFERPAAGLEDNPLICKVASFKEAAQKAGKLGNCIFLATGSNNLATFTTAEELKGKRLIARVLPVPTVIQKCLDLGLSPGQIIAMQGPFGLKLNQAMLKHYGAQVMVTKESGQQGGTDAKIQAALDLGIPVVLIQRPKVDYPVVAQDWEGLKTYLRKFTKDGIEIN